MLFVAVLAIGYTFAISAISQYDFVNDTRYKASEYLDRCGAKTKARAIFSPYAEAVARNLSNRISVQLDLRLTAGAYEDASTVILHETYYGRYSKYLYSFQNTEKLQSGLPLRPNAAENYAGCPFRTKKSEESSSKDSIYGIPSRASSFQSVVWNIRDLPWRRTYFCESEFFPCG